MSKDALKMEGARERLRGIWYIYRQWKERWVNEQRREYTIWKCLVEQESFHWDFDISRANNFSRSRCHPILSTLPARVPPYLPTEAHTFHWCYPIAQQNMQCHHEQLHNRRVYVRRRAPYRLSKCHIASFTVVVAAIKVTDTRATRVAVQFVLTDTGMVFTGTFTRQVQPVQFHLIYDPSSYQLRILQECPVHMKYKPGTAQNISIYMHAACNTDSWLQNPPNGRKYIDDLGEIDWREDGSTDLGHV